MTHTPKLETPPETGAQPVFDSRHAERIYHIGGALKAVSDGRIGGYLISFGNPQQRDSYGEYFTPRADYGLDRYKNQPVLFHHGQNDQLVCCIGIIDTIRVDATGLYAEAQLDVNHEDPAIRRYARTAYDQVMTGKLYWSSGSAGHLVRNTEDGEIIQWWIVEGSLTPKPAEQSGRTQVSALRAAMKAFLAENPDTPPNPEDSADGTATLVEPPAKEQDRDRVSSTPIRSRGKNMTTRTRVKMDMAKIMAVLGGNASLTPEQKWDLAQAMAAEDAGGEDMGDAPATLADEPVDPNLPPAQDAPIAGRSSGPMTAQDVERMIELRMRTAPADPLPGGGGQNPATPATRNVQVEVRTKYHGLSAEDMAFLNSRRKLMAVRSGDAYVPDVAFVREITDKAQKSLRSGGMKSLDEETANRVLAVKDNELDNTTVAAAAGNWVPTLWTSDMWPRVRVENNVAKSLRTIEMPSNTYEVPVENTDPTVNKVPETTNRTQLALDNTSNTNPSSLLGADKTTLVAAKLGLRVGFSAEEEEDSIIPFIPQLREQSMKAMMNAVDSVILNGDTTTTASTNINDSAGTPAATDKFLVFNGARKLGLVTNTAVSVNAGGASPTLQMFRLARFKMQSLLNVYSLYPANLVMFCDPQTYGKILNIDELNVWMNNGRNATVNTGQVPMVDGVELYPSEQLLAANTAGKVDLDVVGNNTTGTIVFMAKLGWTLGYRRQVKTSVDFLPYYDSYQLTATIRLALAYQDTVAAATIYNIGL
jgi:HK97 family phage major capsid protein